MSEIKIPSKPVNFDSSGGGDEKVYMSDSDDDHDDGDVPMTEAMFTDYPKTICPDNETVELASPEMYRDRTLMSEHKMTKKEAEKLKKITKGFNIDWSTIAKNNRKRVRESKEYKGDYKLAFDDLQRKLVVKMYNGMYKFSDTQCIPHNHDEFQGYGEEFMIDSCGLAQSPRRVQDEILNDVTDVRLGHDTIHKRLAHKYEIDPSVFSNGKDQIDDNEKGMLQREDKKDKSRSKKEKGNGHGQKKKRKENVVKDHHGKTKTATRRKDHKTEKKKPKPTSAVFSNSNATSLAQPNRHKHIQRNPQAQKAECKQQ